MKSGNRHNNNVLPVFINVSGLDESEKLHNINVHAVFINVSGLDEM